MKDQNFWKERIKEGAVLDPVDRTAEVLFGLIMVLTFTGAISVASDGRDAVRELLWAALGCNVAWGLVDAIMYLMNLLMERGHSMKVVKKIMNTENNHEAREIVKDEIQPVLSALLNDEELDQLTARLKQLPEPKKGQLLSIKDFISGVQIFFLVFIFTLPVALPFGIFKEVSVAMRVSNGVGLLLLFIGGFKLANYAGFRPWFTAFLYTAIGVLLVALTMALGG